MYETINEELKNKFYDNPLIQDILPEYEKKVLNGEKGSFIAAGELTPTTYRKYGNFHRSPQERSSDNWACNDNDVTH